MSSPVDGPAAAEPSPRGRFESTRWSLVLAAAEKDTPEARDALGLLCESYWYPIYAYIRHKGASAEQAEDLTQEFFARLLQKDLLRIADPGRGRFRAFLMTCLRHFLANENERPRAQKRGGGRPVVSLDSADAEKRYLLEPRHSSTPEKLYERQWALLLLERVLLALREEWRRAGRAEVFDALKSCMTAEGNDQSYAQIASRLGMSGGAIKTTVHRLRQRYRQLLREEIGQMVDNPADVDDEIRTLFEAVG